MSVALPFNPSSLAGARLVARIVWVLLWCSLVLGFSQVASAGCSYGHAEESGISNDSAKPPGYARHALKLGQWVYEAGQIKYVARRSEVPCHGPNCSADQLPSEDAGMSLPQLDRAHLGAAHLQRYSHRIIPGLIDAMPLEDAKAARGYPPAYEYPP